MLKKTFKEQVASLVRAINELGSLFLDDSEELLALDTRNDLDESVVNTVQEVCSLGKDQYAKYCKEVITDCTQSIYEPIWKNALPLFSRSKPKKKKAASIALPKSDVTLFSHLYIIMQHRSVT